MCDWILKGSALHIVFYQAKESNKNWIEIPKVPHGIKRARSPVQLQIPKAIWIKMRETNTTKTTITWIWQMEGRWVYDEKRWNLIYVHYAHFLSFNVQQGNVEREHSL